MQFSRIDICEAAYCFAADHHGGQTTEIYKIFSRLHRIPFRPRQSLKHETLTECGKAAYERFKHYYGVKDARQNGAGMESVQDAATAGGLPGEAPRA